jgi:hypothetical protein
MADCPCPSTSQTYKTTRNPFINFIKAERVKGRYANMSAAKSTKEAAVKWRAMSKDEKKIYEQQAAKSPYNPQVPVFKRLKEHQLGATCRQHLYLFKAAVNRYVEGGLAQLKSADSGCRPCE